MKNSYQNESLPSRVMTESTPSSTTTTTAGTPSSRLLRRRQHFFGGRRGVITTLVAAVVCFSVFLLRTSLFHAVMSPSYVVLPIELEGMSFRHADDGHDIEDGCEATIIRKFLRLVPSFESCLIGNLSTAAPLSQPTPFSSYLFPQSCDTARRAL